MNGSSASIPGTHRFSHDAMATKFEILISSVDAGYAESAAQAAFEELDRLELELSRYVENSEIARINNRTTSQAVKVTPSAFECLELSARLHRETKGAFDVTIGFLLELWKKKREASTPSREDLELALRRTGFERLELDRAALTVRVRRPPVWIDLGGIGKGYAVDCMAALLRDWSIESALIRGGRSSVVAIGSPPGGKGWPLRLHRPDLPERTLARVSLVDGALSGSGLEKGPHIIDPRSGRPVSGRHGAWCASRSGAVADALSTAFMVMTVAEVEGYCRDHPDTLAVVVTGAADSVARYGECSRAELQVDQGKD